MNFDQWGWFFSGEQMKWRPKKKRSSPKMEHFFYPELSGDLRSVVHHSQIIGGEADVDHTQIIGGIQLKYLGDISPIPPGFWHPCSRPRIKNTGASVLQKQNKTKSSSKIFFRRSPKKQKKFEQIFRKVSGTFKASFDLSKSIVLSSAKYRAIFEDLRLRGQGQGLNLWGQSQGLRNESSRPKTSSRTPPLAITLSPCWLHTTN